MRNREDRAQVGSGLAPYLNAVAEGSDLDVRTPLFGGDDRLVVADKWKDILEANSSQLLGRLKEIELDQYGKIGPMSIRLPFAQRMADVQAYFDYPDVNPPDVSAELNILGSGMHSRLRRLRPDAAVRRMVTNSNSGYPRFTRRSKVIPAELSYATTGKWKSFPAILGWRGQSRGFDLNPKQRVVWMFPMSTNILEMSIFGPVQTWLAQMSFLSAWRGPYFVDRSVDRLLRSGMTIYSTDFSGFDQSVGPRISELAFNLLREIFSDSSRDLINELEWNFWNIGLICTKSVYLRGSHGVPSGSVFTNLIDSLVHRIAQMYCARKMGPSLLPDCQVQGDDGLIGFNRGAMNLDSILDCYKEFGFESNIDKQFIGVRDCLYLQRYHHLAYNGGVYPTFRALNALLGHERFYSEGWGPDMVILRSLMILENCKHHPLFIKFVKFAASGDKFKLGLDWPGGMSSFLGSGVISKAKRVAGLIPSYNQERNVDGLAGFEVVKVLRSL